MVLTSQEKQDLFELKQNLREDAYPYFTDEHLVHVLIVHNWDVKNATHHALIEKAENDEITLPSGIKTANNKQYWLGLAKKYRKYAGGMQGRCDID